MAVVTLQVVRETKDLEKFAATVLPADVQATLQIVYLDELQQQARLGNRPTQVLIDGRRGGALLNVKRRAQAYFANAGRIGEALHMAWSMLVSKTRIGRPPADEHPGKARASYALYLNDRAVGGRGDIDRLVKAYKIGDRFSIVGPAVEYGRKLYWNPAGKPRKKRKKVAQSKRRGVVTQTYAVSVVPLHQQVMRLLRRRFPELAISDSWIEALQHGDPRGERWPAISISPKGQKVT